MQPSVLVSITEQCCMMLPPPPSPVPSPPQPDPTAPPHPFNPAPTPPIHLPPQPTTTTPPIPPPIHAPPPPLPPGCHHLLHQGGRPHCEARGCAVLCGQQPQVGPVLHATGFVGCCCCSEPAAAPAWLFWGECKLHVSTLATTRVAYPPGEQGRSTNGDSVPHRHFSAGGRGPFFCVGGMQSRQICCGLSQPTTLCQTTSPLHHHPCACWGLSFARQRSRADRPLSIRLKFGSCTAATLLASSANNQKAHPL